MDNISRFQKTTGVGQILDESFARCPEREAIVFGDWRITYRELQALIYRTAHCLRSLGIAPGDRVAIISRNCPEVMIAEIAILKLGGTVVKFNWRLAPEEMIYLLDLNEVRCAFFKPEREDWGDALRQHYAGRITFLSLTPEADGRSALYSLLAGMPDTPVETVVAPDAPAYHMHTSGTTGRPKCVVYSHARYLNQLESMLETLEFPDGQVYQYISQLFHSACTGAYLTLATGGKLIMIPNFTVSDYVESLVREKVRAIGVIPLILQGILDEMDRKNYDLSHLKVINYSTCPISPDLLRRALDRLNCRFYQSYGMTEMASTVTALLPEDHLILGGRYLTSVGRALPGAAVRIVRPDGSLCDAGEEGEICLSGPTVMLEYVNHPEETAQTKQTHADGLTWIHTGDLGMMDEEGFIYFRQRIKRMIVTNGYNVYPSQLENILEGHEYVHLSCVIGVKDPIKMQRVKAFVVLKPGYVPTEACKQELMDYCRKHIAKYAMPSDIEFREELPKTLVGKVAYRVLEEEENAKLDAKAAENAKIDAQRRQLEEERKAAVQERKAKKAAEAKAKNPDKDEAKAQEAETPKE